MPARRNQRGRWVYRKMVTLPDGRKQRIFGTPQRNTKRAAEAAERLHIARVLGEIPCEAKQKPEPPPEPERRAPLFRDYADKFLDICRLTNKPSEIGTKESVLRVHLVPFFGRMRLDDIRYADIQDYVSSRKKRELADKTINNHLTVLRRSLVIAKKRELIDAVPEFEWLKCPKPEFDFLDFEEAERLVAGADPEWRAQIFTAIRTGMRLGEMRALRWQDVDLKAQRVRVCQSVSRKQITTPKSGRARTIPLGDDVLAALKAHRHLRGQFVFCTADGRMFHKNECKHPLWRACKRAGLRRMGWHCLRHTFASHLVMKAVPIKIVQELLGHATIEMTMRYAHLSPEVPFEAVKALDGGAPEILWHPDGIRMPRGDSATQKVVELQTKK